MEIKKQIMKAVMFDTNIYRGVNKEAFSEILRKEQQIGFKGFVDVWVIRELLSHLGDRADKDFNACRRAIEKVYLHCFDEDLQTLRCVPEASANLVKSLNLITEAHEEQVRMHVNNLIILVGSVYDARANVINNEIVSDCRSIALENEQMKREFARLLTQSFHNYGWQGDMLIELIIIFFGLDNITEENKQRIRFALSLPLNLLAKALNRRAPNGLDENNKDHRNFLVDFDLIFSVLSYIDGVPVYFVTREKELIESVSSDFPKYKQFILGIDEYKKLLDS